MVQIFAAVKACAYVYVNTIIHLLDGCGLTWQQAQNLNWGSAWWKLLANFCTSEYYPQCNLARWSVDCLLRGVHLWILYRSLLLFGTDLAVLHQLLLLSQLPNLQSLNLLMDGKLVLGQSWSMPFLRSKICHLHYHTHTLTTTSNSK